MIQKLKFEERIRDATREEYLIVVKMARELPEMVGGRDIWIINNFNEADFDE